MKRRVVKWILLIGAAVLLLPAIVLVAVVGGIFYHDAKEAAELRAQTDIILDYPGKHDFEMNGQTYSWLPQDGYYLSTGGERGPLAACLVRNDLTNKHDGLYVLRNEHGFDLYEAYDCWVVFCRSDQVEEVEAYYGDNANYDMRNIQCERDFGNAYNKSILLDEGVFEELARLSSVYPDEQNDFEVTDKDSFRLTARSMDGLADKREMLFLLRGQFYNRTGVHAMALPKELNDYLLDALS
jgi:hypothetical protein